VHREGFVIRGQGAGTVSASVVGDEAVIADTQEAARVAHSSVPGGSSVDMKRTFDVVVALSALVLLVPLAIVIAAAVRFSSRGPTIYRQTRVGRHGVPFGMFKFRTMVAGADRERSVLASHNESSGLFKLRRDPRTTPIGRLLRRTSLDELPQLVNVLRGQMSLVGPRPLVPEEDALVNGGHRVRLLVPPGMTGPWQVLGPMRPSLSDMAAIDCVYAAEWSLWGDVKVLLRTVLHVILLRGV
jgi:lipopolysaccharide/colanic/teichoic acid biosynthesis glycosyltransferase